MLEFLRQLRVLGNTWAMAGNFFVTWQGKEVFYCHWEHVTEYITELEGRVLELRHSYTDSSVCSWLAAVEEDFRSSTRSGSCTASGTNVVTFWCLWAVPRVCLSLLAPLVFRVSRGSTCRRGQARVLVSGVANRISLGPCPRHVTTLCGSTMVLVQEARGSTPPCGGREQLCKSWNDQRGCSGKCGREHRCDVVLSNNVPCGSKDHRRLHHDPRTHGVPINRS